MSAARDLYEEAIRLYNAGDVEGEDAPVLDRVLGLLGRGPGWSPA